MNLLNLLEKEMFNKKQLISDLLHQNKDINVDLQDPVTKRTALIEASAQSLSEIVELLIKKGANVNIQDEKGFTALAIASQKGDVEIAKMLIENGAQLREANIKSSSNPLLLACLNNHEQMLEFLIEKGAQVVNVQDEYGNSLFNECLTRGFKRCSSVIRKQSIRMLYETYKNQSSDFIRERLLDSLESENKFSILNLEYFLAFESIDLKNLHDDMDLLQELEYFSSEDFKEKFSESCLRYFENLLQVLSAGKNFLYEDFAHLDRNSFLLDYEANKKEEQKLSLRNLTDLVAHGHLIQFISSNEETQEEIFNKAQHLVNQIELTEKKVREKFELATQLFHAISEKCALLKC